VTDQLTRKAARKGEAKVETLTTRLETLKVEYVAIGSVEPNSYNPNRQSDRDFELLKRSMTEDGFTQPVIVQRATNQIVDGEHRWRAARDLGMTTIPVVFVDMTPEQMRVSTLRHNRARGSENFELSAALLRDLRELGALDWAQDSLMLDDKEIGRLLDDTPVPEVLAGEDFSEAWEPAVERPSDRPAVDAQTIEYNPQGGLLKRPTMMAASPDAMARLEAAQAALDAATTGTERFELIKQRQVFRLSLTFTGDEAAIVRQALGRQPAVTLLEMCRAEMPETKEAAEEVPV
jgi:hypothetical protein